LLQGGQRVVTDSGQHGRILPVRVGHQVMQRLVTGADVAGIEARRHGFDTLAFARQQQAGGIEAQRLVAIGMAHGIGQQVHVVLETLLAGCRRGRNRR
jgi:hypothetical protein